MGPPTPQNGSNRRTRTRPEPRSRVVARRASATLLLNCHARKRAVGARLRASVALGQHSGSLRRKSIRRKSRRLRAGRRRRRPSWGNLYLPTPDLPVPIPPVSAPSVRMFHVEQYCLLRKIWDISKKWLMKFRKTRLWKRGRRLIRVAVRGTG